MNTDRFKFRVWDKGLKIFTNNCCIKEDSRLFSISTYNIITVLNRRNFTVDKCTGLKDKNGKLIYEGDLIKFKNNNMKSSEILGFVQYCDLRLCYTTCKNIKEYLDNKYTGLPLNDSCDNGILESHKLEIIGNIHENPELLK